MGVLYSIFGSSSISESKEEEQNLEQYLIFRKNINTSRVPFVRKDIKIRWEGGQIKFPPGISKNVLVLGITATLTKEKRKGELKVGEVLEKVGIKNHFVEEEPFDLKKVFYKEVNLTIKILSNINNTEADMIDYREKVAIQFNCKLTNKKRSFEKEFYEKVINDHFHNDIFSFMSWVGLDRFSNGFLKDDGVIGKLAALHNVENRNDKIDREECKKRIRERFELLNYVDLINMQIDEKPREHENVIDICFHVIDFKRGIDLDTKIGDKQLRI